MTSEMAQSETSGQIADEIQLLAEIVTARASGSNDSQAGTSDEDLLYAIEEAESHLEALKRELKARGA